MPSEREIDDYIDGLEEKNQIYMEEELEYADKCHKLEEELGCPLEIVIKALKYGIYYVSKNGNTLLERSFKLNRYSSGWCLIKPKFSFPLEGYKKTWWLKWDRSE